MAAVTPSSQKALEMCDTPSGFLRNTIANVPIAIINQDILQGHIDTHVKWEDLMEMDFNCRTFQFVVLCDQ
ncbi:hypothetical protein BBBOND_0404420 [Babesia bigemina]|uniref:Uncharacterized protein n=1 Tax=Babesia bigemina TaxID=5866 RepID=A0A061DE38_BABBI|nr:hypothetical protein BBBOND_0404420 [Babesia bigemina]CDR97954.1 hypothetical protein BBBOND_0404420 [Babesia bigemina]|eukprot:XP_012770140.1 hypothetical protein BBBOND_0404420 [Babesia bigemina]